MESQRAGELRYAVIAEITTEDEFNPRSRIDEEALTAAGVAPGLEGADEKAQKELRRERAEQVAARGANLDPRACSVPQHRLGERLGLQLRLRQPRRPH